jgi:hypothetical protein
MHAALVTITIDPSQAPAAAAALMDDILPRVTSAPGVSIDEVEIRRVAVAVP